MMLHPFIGYIAIIFSTCLVLDLRNIACYASILMSRNTYLSNTLMLILQMERGRLLILFIEILSGKKRSAVREIRLSTHVFDYSLPIIISFSVLEKASILEAAS